MADAAAAEPLPESRDASDEVGPGHPPVATRFEKGRSGNPGGRPKGLARKVREVLGNDDGEVLARLWAAITTGVLVTRIPTYGPDGTPTGEKVVVEQVSVADRIAASKLLAERGWGKPPQFAPIEDDDPLDLAERETAEIAAAFDTRIDELAARREEKAATG
jgi:hypothetical protein